MDMSIYIAGTRLADYTDFVLLNEENSKDNRTLGGKLYTDFLNILRSWSISWALLTKAQYDVIYNLYRNQFRTGYYPVVYIPALGINLPMKLSISNPKLKWNGTYIEGFTLIALEQYAIS